MPTSSAAAAPNRNLLVHVYWTVDYDQVFDILERRLGDPRASSRAMAGLL